MAELYNIDFGYHYDKNNLYSAMKKAIESNDESILNSVVEFKQKYLDKSVREINKIL
mgnify:CR=1 FL=1